MKKSNKNRVHEIWLKANEELKDNKLEDCDDTLMGLILYLAQLTEQGTPGSTKIEGVKLDIWKDRAWQLLENAGLLP